MSGFKEVNSIPGFFFCLTKKALLEVGYFDEEFEGTLDEAMKEYEAGLLRRLYPAYPSTRQLAKKLGVSHTAIANNLPFISGIILSVNNCF